MIEEAL